MNVRDRGLRKAFAAIDQRVRAGAKVGAAEVAALKTSALEDGRVGETEQADLVMMLDAWKDSFDVGARLQLQALAGVPTTPWNPASYGVDVRVRDGDLGVGMPYHFGARVEDEQVTVTVPEAYRQVINRDLDRASLAQVPSRLVLPLTGRPNGTFRCERQGVENGVEITSSIFGGVTNDNRLWFGVEHLVKVSGTFATALAGRADQRRGTFSEGTITSW